MKHIKLCSVSHVAILIAVLLGGCGNKGPLVVIEPKVDDEKASQQTETQPEIERKKKK